MWPSAVGLLSFKMLPGCGSAASAVDGGGGWAVAVQRGKKTRQKQGRRDAIAPKISSLTVEKSRPEELREERLLGDVGDLPDLLRGALAKLLTVHPLADQDPPRAQLLVHPRHGDADDACVDERLSEPHLIPRLVREVQLRVEPDGPLVQERDVVRALLRREALDQSLEDLRGPSQHVQVLRHGREYVRALHLHRDPRAEAVVQRREVDLREARGRDRLLGYRREELPERTPELLLDLPHGHGRVEPDDRILQPRELVESGLR